MTLDELKRNTTTIGKALGQHVNHDLPEEISGMIEELTALLALSSYTVAASEAIYNQKLMDLAEDSKYSTMNATEKKMIFAGRAKNEIYYMTLSERQNKAISHKLDGLRSILSYLKSEAQNIK